MNWRNQLRDLSILYSLSDDLKLFWHLKAMKWEKLEIKVRQVAEQTSGYRSIVDEEDVAARFKKLILANAEYQEVRHRIRTEMKEVLDMAEFLDVAPPDGIEDLNFKPPLMSNKIIERVVEGIDEFIPLCRVSSYPYHYFWQALKLPIQFTKSAWQFYRG